MHEVRIYFAGISTFLEGFANFTPLRTEPPIRRMVLVNANVPSITMGDDEVVTVAPHYAHLHFHTSFEHSGEMPPPVGGSDDVFDLNGPSAYTITVQNPVTPPGQDDPWHDATMCLPNLRSTLTQDQIGPPSLSVLAGGDAACYVDFTRGMIDGLVAHNDRGVTRATIFTDSQPQLLITREGASSATVTLTETPAVISITNKPDPPEGDGRVDFYLNFLLLAVEYRPPTQDVIIPTGVSCTETDPKLPPGIMPDDAGPGCSTTDYP